MEKLVEIDGYSIQLHRVRGKKEVFDPSMPVFVFVVKARFPAFNGVLPKQGVMRPGYVLCATSDIGGREYIKLIAHAFEGDRTWNPVKCHTIGTFVDILLPVVPPSVAPPLEDSDDSPEEDEVSAYAFFPLEVPHVVSCYRRDTGYGEDDYYFVRRESKMSCCDWSKAIAMANYRSTEDALRRSPNVFLLPEGNVDFLKNQEQWENGEVQHG